MSSGLSVGRWLAIAAMCVVALVGSVLLAWWQWTRYEGAGGSIQNFGYMLQWPLFGVFPAFMVWRIRRLARRGDEPEPVTADPPATPGEPRRKLGYVPPARPADADQDPTLAEYNRYLAELNARDEAARDEAARDEAAEGSRS